MLQEKHGIENLRKALKVITTITKMGMELNSFSFGKFGAALLTSSPKILLDLVALDHTKLEAEFKDLSSAEIMELLQDLVKVYHLENHVTPEHQEMIKALFINGSKAIAVLKQSTFLHKALARLGS